MISFTFPSTAVTLQWSQPSRKDSGWQAWVNAVNEVDPGLIPGSSPFSPKRALILWILGAWRGVPTPSVPCSEVVLKKKNHWTFKFKDNKRNHSWSLPSLMKMISIEISRMAKESFDSFFMVDFCLQQYAGQLGWMIRKMSREFSSDATYRVFQQVWNGLIVMFWSSEMPEHPVSWLRTRFLCGDASFVNV